MHKKVNINSILGIFVSIIFFIIVFVQFQINNEFNIDMLMNRLMIISFIFAIIILYIIHKNEKKIVTLYSIYVIFFYIFNFGLLFLRYVLKYECNSITEYLDYIFTKYSLFNAALLSTYCLISLFLAYSIKIIFIVKNNNTQKNKKIYNIVKLETLFKFILIISGIFIIKDYILTFKLVMQSGYSGNYNDLKFGIDSIGEKIIPFFTIAIFILIMIYSKTNKNKAKLYYYLGIIYNFSLLILGERGKAVLTIVILVFIWYTYVEKIKFKNIIIFVTLSSVILLSISIIRENRKLPLNEWENPFVLIKDATKNNIFYDVIYEMGLAIYPTASAIKVFPSIIPYYNGETYIFSIINSVKFNILSDSSVNRDITNYYNIGYIIGKQQNIQYGSSIIEEAYGNFGKFSVIFFILFGMVLLSFINHYYRNNKSKNYVDCALSLYLFIEIIWSIRNVTYNIPRIIIMYYIFPIILLKILKIQIREKVK